MKEQEGEVKNMAKKELSPAIMENEQVKDIIYFASLLAKLNELQKAKIEGIAIGMTLEQSAKNTA